MGFRFRTENREARSLPSDVPHVDTNIGALPRPIYRFRGRLNAGDSQYLVQVIPTTDMAEGKIRFSASLRLRTKDGPLTELESGEVAVKLVEPRREEEAGAFSPKEVRVICRAVVGYHNHRRRAGFYRGEEHDALAAVAKKALELDAKDLLTEYALYAAVFQELAPKATPEDLAFAEEAAKAFFERFRESWLRAHVYAAMFEIDPERARKLVENPFDLPGAELLFDNLGILDDVRKAVGIEEEEDEEEEGGERASSDAQQGGEEDAEPK